MFTFTDRISVRRETSDGAGDDEAIAKAIAEESNAANECLTADRKLTEKVNKAQIRELVAMSVSVSDVSHCFYPVLPTIGPRVEQSVTIITYLGISILACSLSPTAFCVGLSGAFISTIVISPTISLLAKYVISKDGYIFPLMSDILGAIGLAGSLICSAKMVTSAGRTALTPAIFATLGGYYAPLSLYHEVRALISSI